MIKKGNILTFNQYGTYGFLSAGQMPDTPLTLLDFGLERRCDETYDFDNRSRDYAGYLFQYTLSGQGTFEAEGTLYPQMPGTAFFSCIPENSRYYLPSGAHETNWEFIYVHFTGPAAGPFFREIQTNYGRSFRLPADSFPSQLWLNLHRDMNDGRQLRLYEGGELVYRFLSSLLRTLESPVEHIMSHPIEKSLRYMKAHFREHFSIDDLARQNGLSSAYFTRIFTRETGESPLLHLTRLRINHALFLLLNTQMSVEQIALECGFSCGNYFCKVFRRASGCSPAEYRRRYGA